MPSLDGKNRLKTRKSNVIMSIAQKERARQCHNFYKLIFAISELVQATHLHEEPCYQSFPDVDVIVSWSEVCAWSFEVESVHNACQLLPYVVCTFKRTEVNEVVIAPLWIFLIWKNYKETIRDAGDSDKSPKSVKIEWWSTCTTEKYVINKWKVSGSIL